MDSLTMKYYHYLKRRSPELVEEIKEWLLPAFIILVLIILGAAFYRYDLRPAQIREFCREKATEFADDLVPNRYRGYEVFGPWAEAYDSAYQVCISRQGI